MIRTIFCQFSLGDVDDPEIYLAAPVYEWQQTDHGKWVMENCKDVSYSVSTESDTFSYRVTIYGHLEDKEHTYYRLKYGATS